MAMTHLSVFVLLVTVCRFSESADPILILSNASVCLGDQFRVTCRLQQTNDSFFNWDVETANGSTNFTFLGYAPGYMTSIFVVDGVEFLVTLLSTKYDPRALTEMFIRNVSANLNGTTANCTSSFGRRVTTLITVVTNVTITNPVIAINERFDRDFVTVSLEWTVQEHVSYNITVTPAGSYYSLRPVITGNGSASQELTLAYNVMYNVSFVATRCQANVSRVFEFYYVKCGYPLSSSDDVIGLVSGYSDPALVRSNATVWCPNQPTGSRSTVITCMNNGNWYPQPGLILQACSTTEPSESGGGVQSQDTSTVIIVSVLLVVVVVILIVVSVVLHYIIGKRMHRNIKADPTSHITDSKAMKSDIPHDEHKVQYSKLQRPDKQNAGNTLEYAELEPVTTGQSSKPPDSIFIKGHEYSKVNKPKSKEKEDSNQPMYDDIVDGKP